MHLYTLPLGRPANIHTLPTVTASSDKGGYLPAWERVHTDLATGQLVVEFRRPLTPQDERRYLLTPR